MSVSIESLGENKKVRIVTEDEQGKKHVLSKAPGKLTGKISPDRAEYRAAQLGAASQKIVTDLFENPVIPGEDVLDHPELVTGPDLVDEE